MKEYNLKQYAHIGDSVWELFIRLYIIEKNTTSKALHTETTKRVNADFQAKILEKLELTEDEKILVKRGRTLPLTVQKRNNQSIHRLATALEVVIGFLYLNNKSRLSEIFEFIKENAL